MYKKNIIVGCTILLFLFNSYSLKAIESASSVDELDKRISDIVEETKLPGMIGAIVYGDETIWLGSHGIADKESGRKVDNGTLFRVGSISKIFVSLSILKLAEQNRLNLSDPIGKLVPEINVKNSWEANFPVKLLHVLEHTAGLKDIDYRVNSFGADITTRQAVEINKGALQIQWQPGTRMAYSNIGPVIAALAIENITGDTYKIFVGREVFGTLGMDSATFEKNAMIASSYTPGGVRIPYDHISVPPSGAVNATNNDMAHLLRMFNNRGFPLISKESLNRMETPTSTMAAKNGLRAGFGLGNYTIQKEGYVFQGHEGSIEGFRSLFAYLPEANRGYFFSMNQPNAKAGRRIDQELFAFITKEISQPIPTPSTKANTEVQKFAGQYARDDVYGNTVKLIINPNLRNILYEEGKLYIESRSGKTPAELIPVGNNLFRMANNALPSYIFIQGNGDVYMQSDHDAWTKVGVISANAQLIVVTFLALLIISYTFLIYKNILRRKSHRSSE